MKTPGGVLQPQMYSAGCEIMRGGGEVWEMLCYQLSWFLYLSRAFNVLTHWVNLYKGEMRGKVMSTSNSPQTCFFHRSFQSLHHF